MKKLFAFVLAATLLFSVGTALAQNTVELNNVFNDPAQRVFYPPVYSKMNTGASAYLVTNQPYFSANYTFGGTSVWAISNERTNAAGTEMRAVILTDVGNNNLGGVTPIGGPQLLTGTTEVMVLYVLAANAGVQSNAGAFSGASLYRINGGTGVVELEVGVPFTGFPISNQGTLLPNAMNDTIAGNTPWCLAPVTLEWDNATSAASVFGCSGTTLGSTGVSVWRRSSGTLAAPAVQAGTTVFAGPSGVSSVAAAPVISGQSIFYVTNYVEPTAEIGVAGISVFQFYKQDFTVGGGNIYGAGLNSAQVLQINPTQGINGGNGAAYVATGVSAAALTPTPCAQTITNSNGVVTGGTLYVVTWFGGVTLYDTQDLSMVRGNYGGQGVADCVYTNSGVTASPVCTEDKLIIAWSSGLSCFETRNAIGSGVSMIWSYDFDTAVGAPDQRFQIWSTPVISAGYAWVNVYDTATGQDTIYRFQLNNTYQGNPTIVTTEPRSYGGPIVVDSTLWYCSFNPQVDKNLSQGPFTRAYDYWPQFKFGADKRGENTEPVDDDDDWYDDDSSGCFLTTIK